MVDYDKLNYAHDLTEKYYEQTKTMTWIKIMISSVSDLIGYQWTALHDCLLKCEDIDELIAELEKQTRAKPKQKYAVGDVFWYIGSNGIFNFTITQKHLELIDEEIFGWSEDELYPTREALIDAQVEYWQKLRCQGGGHAYDTDSSICLYCDTIKHSQPTVTIKGGTLALSEFDTVKVRGVERAVTEFDSCTHERDESKGRKLMYTPSEMGWVYVYPCKHCGEFFLDAMV